MSGETRKRPQHEADGWLHACAVAAVSEDEGHAIVLDDRHIGLFKIDGEIYALDNICPHEFALLTGGFVEDGLVECPLHQACFDIKTGRKVSGPAERDARAVRVKVENGQVYVDPRD
ncbi:non-heme iron oxygenase ferredoxin subunit [Bradyrhizobium tropiciagri]|uniref:non-heme iron oxygenase ferredoxin subunit n=1 Tax=Bradyrhizobium tropiciagri TaxID=312253 RepID=UPI001BAD173F|nr:non-heme iron oxygenase ferredoxin subunit [Bradyrhizobium tropiciagri]MBR0896765.1 non-heme iron oxygenase ferredoxin subunit [Bradyrhizobium tropiciagri]